MRALIVGLFVLAGPVRATTPVVIVDPRLELDGVYQLRSGSAPPVGFVLPPSEFTDGFVGTPSAPPPAGSFFDRAQVLMRLGPAPELKGLERVPETIIAAAGGRAAVTAWIGALRALALVNEAALKDEARLLAPAAEAFRVRLTSGGYISALEEYAGLPMPGPHRVMLSAFHTPGSIANAVIDRRDGGVEVDSLFGPDWTTGEPDFWTPRVPGTLWHEQAHGVADPLADLWAEPIARAKPADASAICYGQWRQCVREHVVRALMLRLMERELGPAAATEQRDFEKHGDFRWLPAMEERLKEYENNRSKYPTLADFFPRLIEVVGVRDTEGEPFDPSGETALVRARAVRLARTALPKAAVPAVRRRLKRAVGLALAPAPAEEELPPRDPNASKASSDAIAAFTAGRRDEALALFDLALKLDPYDGEAALSRATVLESLGRGEEALAACASAAAAARRRTGSYQPRLLADALLAEARLALLKPGREKRASAALAEALEAAPADWRGRTEAAALLKKLKAR